MKLLSFVLRGIKRDIGSFFVYFIEGENVESFVIECIEFRRE